MKGVATSPTAGHPVGEDDLQSWVDGQLPPERHDVVRAWLDAHPDVLARVEVQAALTKSLRAKLTDELGGPLPPRLRIRTILARQRRERRTALMRIAASFVLITLGTALGWGGRGALDVREGDHASTGAQVATTRPASLDIPMEATIAHRVFVAEARHPVEVRAEEGAHLVQWLSNRLGRQLATPDLQPLGYRLMGGRLLPGDSAGPAAQFMYDDDAGTRLTVYLRASEVPGTTAFRFAEADGVAAFWWVDRGFSYAVSAGADRGHLLRVAEAVHAQLAPDAS